MADFINDQYDWFEYEDEDEGGVFDGPDRPVYLKASLFMNPELQKKLSKKRKRDKK